MEYEKDDKHKMIRTKRSVSGTITISLGVPAKLGSVPQLDETTLKLNIMVFNKPTENEPKEHEWSLPAV